MKNIGELNHNHMARIQLMLFYLYDLKKKLFSQNHFLIFLSILLYYYHSHMMLSNYQILDVTMLCRLLNCNDYFLILLYLDFYLFAFGFRHMKILLFYHHFHLLLNDLNCCYILLMLYFLNVHLEIHFLTFLIFLNIYFLILN